MITRSNPTRPRYISRVMVLPLAGLLFCAFAAKEPTSGFSSAHKAVAGALLSSDKARAGALSVSRRPDSLLRFYLRGLRYPAAALKQGREETIWFSVRIGGHNQLLEFRQYEKEPD